MVRIVHSQCTDQSSILCAATKNIIIMNSDYIKINNIRFNIEIIGYPSHHCFIRFESYSNDYLFRFYSISKEKLSKSILNYYIDGDWPFCKSKEDCLKLLFALLDEIKSRYDVKIETSLRKPQEENCWND